MSCICTEHSPEPLERGATVYARRPDRRGLVPAEVIGVGTGLFAGQVQVRGLSSGLRGRVWWRSRWEMDTDLARLYAWLRCVGSDEHDAGALRREVAYG